MALLRFRQISLADWQSLEVKDPDTRYIVYNEDESIYGEFIGDMSVANVAFKRYNVGDIILKKGLEIGEFRYFLFSTNNVKQNQPYYFWNNDTGIRFFMASVIPSIPLRIIKREDATGYRVGRLGDEGNYYTKSYGDVRFESTNPDMVIYEIVFL